MPFAGWGSCVRLVTLGLPGRDEKGNQSLKLNGAHTIAAPAIYADTVHGAIRLALAAKNRNRVRSSSLRIQEP